MRTWYTRRAALTHFARESVARLLSEQDQMQRALRSVSSGDPQWDGWRARVKQLKSWSKMLSSIQAAEGPPVEQREPKHSKRSDIKGLPAGWRSELIRRLPKYRRVALTQAVTGCRPDELVTGVRLAIDGGELVAVVEGSKVGETSGQPWRRLFWPADSQNELVKDLIAEVQAAGGSCIVTVEDGRRYSGAVRAAGKRAWPSKPDLSAYSFRHAAASDMKASGLPSEEISAALGHRSDVTKSMYGHQTPL
jgi:integrase